MDPVAHTFTAATLAATGLRRQTPLATAVLLIGANAPDVDALTFFGEPFQSLAFRRGATHGVLALAIWPFVIAALVLVWDRWVRRKARPAASHARAGPVLWLAAIAVATHPALDWLNNYGMRWLMPFDGRWFYGDAIFIVDPWIWLGLGAIPFLVHSRSMASLTAWSAFWLLASLLVLTTAGVPVISRGLWLVGIAAMIAIRARRPRWPNLGDRYRRSAAVLLAVAATYVGTMALADFAERAIVRSELTLRGIESIEHIMVAPVAANPFAGEVVVATPTEYLVGEWHWLSDPRFTAVGEPLPRNGNDPIYTAAAATAEAKRFLTWARFPFAKIEARASGYEVRFLDARYHTVGRLVGPIVLLDRELKP